MPVIKKQCAKFQSSATIRDTASIYYRGGNSMSKTVIELYSLTQKTLYYLRTPHRH